MKNEEGGCAARSSCGPLWTSTALGNVKYVNICNDIFGCGRILLKPREKGFESLVCKLISLQNNCKLISLQNKLIRTTFELIDYSKMFSLH